jgi:ketosteroid isomerase-like protein
MSQADIEALRAEYEAISRRDWDAVFREVHSDFEFQTPERSAAAAEREEALQAAGLARSG